MHVVSQLIAGRQALYAGEVSIRGLERHTDLENKNPPKVRIINELIRFDFANGRSWHEVEGTWANMPTDIKPDTDIHVFGKDGYYLKTVRSKHISVASPRAPNGFWDPRVFGLCTYDDLLTFTAFSEFEKVFQEAATGGTLSVLNQNTDEMTVIDYLNCTSDKTPETLDVRRRIWIDPARGYVPVRTEQQFRRPDAPDADKDGWQPPYSISTATWDLHNDDVWVPGSAVVMMKVSDSSGAGMTIEYELAFDWHSVNPPLDESLFSIERLDTPPGSHFIVDFTRDRANPIFLQHPSVPDGRKLREILEANAKKPEPPIPTASSSHLYLLVAFFAMLATGFFFSWRSVYISRKRSDLESASEIL